MEEIRIQGLPVSEGVAIGVPFFLESLDEEIPAFPITMGEVDEEIDRYRKALFSSREDLVELQTHLVKEGSKDAITILDTHIQMLEDPLMTTHMEEKIRQMLQNTESVFDCVIRDYEAKFSKKTDAFFQERMVDVVDLAKRVLGHLRPRKGTSLFEVPFNSIVFAREVLPSHVAAAEISKISGLVTLSGGGNSHAALIARAKGIPYVSSVDIQILHNTPVQCAIVDGQTGEVVLNPSVTTLAKYKQRKILLKTSLRLLQEEAHLPAETRDGFSVSVHANLGGIEDLDQFHTCGASGVGLFRTEYLFFNHPSFVNSEEEQYATYSKFIQGVGSLPIVIRAFDIGPDKVLDLELTFEKDPDSFIGDRGIRFLLQYRGLFKAQVRAVLRAAVKGNVKFMLPFVVDSTEVEKSRRLIKECIEELQAEGIPFNPHVEIGCMIETPSSVMLCDGITEGSDFLSIGTNDLVQYSLGVDRNDPARSGFRHPSHPSIPRMIKMIVEEGKRQNKKVALCGEIGSNPIFIPLLLGLGIQELSCSPRYIPMVKKRIRQTDLSKAFELASRVLQMQSTAEVSQALLEGYR